ncbi:MAG: hypothetical protein WEB58_06425 [Planctomycetaceae bacterium]
MTRLRMRASLADVGFSRESVAQGVLATLWLFAGIICWRRLAGGFSPPASIGLAIFAGLTATLAGMCAWWWKSAADSIASTDKSPASLDFLSVSRLIADPRWQGFDFLLPPFILGWALLPDRSVMGVSLLSAGTAVALCGMNWSREALKISADLAELTDQADTVYPQVLAVESDDEHEFAATSSIMTATSAAPIFEHIAAEERPTVDEVVSDVDLEPKESPRSEHVTLWMTRQRDGDGCDSLEGGTKVHFLAGQKLSVVHLGFFPSFAQTPEMECEILDEGTFHIRPPAVYPYGARLEIQRSAPLDDGAVVELGFLARAQRPALSPAA